MKKNRMDIIILKNGIQKIKVKRFNSRINMTEGRLSILEDGIVEITQMNKRRKIHTEEKGANLCYPNPRKRKKKVKLKKKKG